MLVKNRKSLPRRNVAFVFGCSDLVGLVHRPDIRESQRAYYSDGHDYLFNRPETSEMREWLSQQHLPCCIRPAVFAIGRQTASLHLYVGLEVRVPESIAPVFKLFWC